MLGSEMKSRRRGPRDEDGMCGSIIYPTSHCFRKKGGTVQRWGQNERGKERKSPAGNQAGVSGIDLKLPRTRNFKNRARKSGHSACVTRKHMTLQHASEEDETSMLGLGKGDQGGGQT